MTTLLHSATFILSQDGDCNSDDQQELRVTLEEGGAGAFLTVSTDRWAFETNRELGELLARIEAAVRPLFGFTEH